MSGQLLPPSTGGTWKITRLEKNTSGTYTPEGPGILFLTGAAAGAAGGGQTASSNWGGGGGGAGEDCTDFPYHTDGSAISYTIPNDAAGVAGANGNDGADLTFGRLTLKGGIHGRQSGLGGNGGAGHGTAPAGGNPGEDAVVEQNFVHAGAGGGNGGSGAAGAKGGKGPEGYIGQGNGGPSGAGGGGGGSNGLSVGGDGGHTLNSDGLAGTGPGAGGGGASGSATCGVRTGGAGNGGELTIREWVNA